MRTEPAGHWNVIAVTQYYVQKLSGRRLRLCYELAPPRVRQYLEAEVAHVVDNLRLADKALELGCGYGRVTLPMARRARSVTGIDVSEESLRLARMLAAPLTNCEFRNMDATALSFDEAAFDAVVCVQNGVCAFGVDRPALVREALRVLKPGGRLLLSTYSARFWEDRLAWFEAQADAGLVGPLDRERTCDGVIVCGDGLRLETASGEELLSLCAAVGVEGRLREVDGSSLFCEAVK